MKLRAFGLTVILTLINSAIYLPQSQGQKIERKVGMDAQRYQKEVPQIIEYFKQHGYGFERESLYEGHERWVLINPAEGGGKLTIYSFRAYPLSAAKESIERELMTISIPFVLNDAVKVAMAYPQGTYSPRGDDRMKEAIIKLFVNYKKETGRYRPIVYASRGELKVSAYYLKDAGQIPAFEFLGLWRYDPESKQWEKVRFQINEQPVIREPSARDAYPSSVDQQLLHLTDEIGLYWAQWKEGERVADSLVFVADFNCQDLMLGEPPSGMIAACVPFAESALATFVPDPKIHCRG